MGEFTLLIGGSSSVGKTHVAREFSERLGLQHVGIDDLVGLPEHRELASFGDFLAKESVPVLLERLKSKGSTLKSGIAKKVARAAEIGGVIEGEGIEPSMSEVFPKASFLFIVQPDPRILHEVLTKRSTKYCALPEGLKETLCQVNAEYNKWITLEARERGLPVLLSHPFETQLSRVKMLVGI